MKEHLLQTVEILKNRVSENLEKVRENEKLIRQALAQPYSKERDNYLKEMHAENRQYLEENAEAIRIQLDIIRFTGKYKKMWALSGHVVGVAVYKDLSDDEIFKQTIEGKIPYNSFHPKYGDDGFIDKLMEYYLLREEYEMCNLLLGSKKVS